jgi:oligopeptide transport system permease protein
MSVWSGGNVWHMAGQRLLRDRIGLSAMLVAALFLVLVAVAKAGWVAQHWQREVGVPYANPTFLGPTPVVATEQEQQDLAPRVDISSVDPLAPRYAEWAALAALQKTEETPRANTLLWGGDRMGRDVLSKAIKGAEVSIFVGVSAALVATLIGTVLGALGGYFGRVVGDVLEWVYNVFTAIPGILLIFAFAAVLGRGTNTVVLILGLTGWTGTYRLVRAEFLKHRSRDYVRAAQALGASHSARIVRHILPNVSHVVLVQLSILVVGCIKAEVILSYLGLGVSVDQVSWGTMLADAQTELLLGYWWQLAAATTCMAVFVTAFSLFTDALRDALDPRLRGE